MNHCARIEFTYWVDDKPSDDDWKPDKLVPIQWNMVLPGRYWLKAVWNRAAKENEELDPIVKIAGDFHTTESKVFEVKAGREVEIGIVPCKTAVESTKKVD